MMPFIGSPRLASFFSPLIGTSRQIPARERESVRGDITSVRCTVPALRRIDGAQLHSSLGERRHRQTDAAVALRQLRRIPGSLYPVQPNERLGTDTAAHGT
jgi:hypothetical protein